MFHYTSNAEEQETYCGKDVWRVKETTHQVSLVSCKACKTALDRRKGDVVKRLRRRGTKQLGGNYHILEDSPLKVRVEDGQFKGKVFEAIGEFRQPEKGEFFLSRDERMVVVHLGGRIKPDSVIFKEARVKELLTEKHILDWINGHSMRRLVIECHACDCDGWTGPVYTRTSPHGFAHLGIYHEGTCHSLATIEHGKVRFDEGVVGSVFVHEDEYADHTDYDFPF